MKVFQLAGSVALLLLGFTRFALGQAEQAWEISHNSGTEVTYLQSDDEDNVYEVEQGATSATFNVLDPYGNLVKSRLLQGTVVSLTVDPFTGVAAVATKLNGFLFYWDGESLALNPPGGATVIGGGLDEDDQGIFAYNLGSVTEVATFSEFSKVTSRSVAVLGSSAQVDMLGHIAIFGSSGNLSDSTTYVEVCDGIGDDLFERSYSFEHFGGTQIAGYAYNADAAFFELSVKGFGVGSTYVYVAAILFNNGSSDLWDSPQIDASIGPIFTDSLGNPYLGSSNQVVSLTAGEGKVAWTASVPSGSGIAENALGLVAEAYDSLTANVTLSNLSLSNGSVLSEATIPIPASASIGPFTAGGASDAVYFGGSTGGASSESEVVSVVYGPALSAAICQPSVIGGSALLLTLKVDAVPPSPIALSLTSSEPDVISNGNLSLAQDTPFALDTAPVDLDTPVTLSAAMGSPNVLRSATTVVRTATLASLKLGEGATTATGTVTLSGKAGPSGKTVTLSSNVAAVTVPASVTVAPGATSNTFTATLHAVSASTTVTITASLAGTSQFATIVVSPAALSSLVAPSKIEGGDTGNVTINLSGAAGPNGDLVTVNSNSADLAVTSSVLVPGGKGTVTFLVTTKAVAANANVTITATFNGVSKTATTTLTATASAVSSISLNPTTVVGGKNVEALVVLNAMAPPAGVVVTLKSNSMDATVPPTITIPAEAKQMFFVVKTAKVTKAASVTITASFNSTSAPATLSVNP